MFALVSAIPVAVPDIFLAGKAASSDLDRGHSLCSLYLPLAAVASLPTGILRFRCSSPKKDSLNSNNSKPSSCSVEVARQEGLEPPTYCLEGSCSIQLSYWRIYGAGDGNRTRVSSLEGWCSTIELHPRILSSLFQP